MSSEKESLAKEERTQCLRLDPYDPTYSSFEELEACFNEDSPEDFGTWLEEQLDGGRELPEDSVIVVRKDTAGTLPNSLDCLYVLPRREYYRQLALGAKLRIEEARKDLNKYLAMSEETGL